VINTKTCEQWTQVGVINCNIKTSTIYQ
jgi:hypothetical protein